MNRKWWFSKGVHLTLKFLIKDVKIPQRFHHYHNLDFKFLCFVTDIILVETLFFLLNSSLNFCLLFFLSLKNRVTLFFFSSYNSPHFLCQQDFWYSKVFQWNEKMLQFLRLCSFSQITVLFFQKFWSNIVISTFWQKFIKTSRMSDGVWDPCSLIQTF